MHASLDGLALTKRAAWAGRARGAYAALARRARNPRAMATARAPEVAHRHARLQNASHAQKRGVRCRQARRATQTEAAGTGARVPPVAVELRRLDSCQERKA
jgi:hypothetical protein